MLKSNVLQDFHWHKMNVLGFKAALCDLCASCLKRSPGPSKEHGDLQTLGQAQDNPRGQCQAPAQTAVWLGFELGMSMELDAVKSFFRTVFMPRITQKNRCLEHDGNLLGHFSGYALFYYVLLGNWMSSSRGSADFALQRPRGS